MTQGQLNEPDIKDGTAKSDIQFVLDGKFILNYNPYRADPNTLSELEAEIERQRTCKHAYCLNCGHVQKCGFDDVFVCEECGWQVGEAIP